MNMKREKRGGEGERGRWRRWSRGEEVEECVCVGGGAVLVFLPSLFPDCQTRAETKREKQSRTQSQVFYVFLVLCGSYLYTHTQYIYIHTIYIHTAVIYVVLFSTDMY